VILTLVFGLLIENLNLGYIFWMIGTMALTFNINISCNKTFLWVHVPKIDLVTLIFVFDLYIENFKPVFIVWMLCTKTLIFHMCVFFFWQDLSLGTNKFDLVTLVFDLYIQNFTHDYSIFWMICACTFIFQMSVVTNPFSGKPMVWPYDLDFNVWSTLEFWYFTWLFLVTRPFCGYQQVWPFDLDLCIWPTYRKLQPWLYLLNGMN
jgi:hypothetical protein